MATRALKAYPRAFQVEREVGFDEDMSRARPGDVSLDLGYGRTMLDIIVINPFTVARIRASRNAGSPAVAAEEAYDKKVRKYSDLIDSLTDIPPPRFVPLAVTATGMWYERSSRWLRKFSSTCAAASGADTGAVFSELMIRLAVALWRGNSAMIRFCNSEL